MIGPHVHMGPIKNEGYISLIKDDIAHVGFVVSWSMVLVHKLGELAQ